MKEYIIAEKELGPAHDYFAELFNARELILCKDCKYRDEQTANCTRFRKDWYVQSNSFCSWADRKED